MKRINYYIGIGLALLMCTASCDNYLDKMPDKRAEVNSLQKAEALLVSAYPNVDPMMIYEHRTDNVMDNGKRYGTPTRMIQENYYWKDISETEWDAPERLWSYCYKAVATANQALESLKNIAPEKQTPGVRAEALLCRAYAHFMLVNTFCQPYSPKSADKDLGIPYVTKVETEIGTQYERGTVKEVYEKLAADIEEAFPNVDESYFSVPLYHFNKRAAAAFAARFYLYYGKYEKALEYANMAIPEDPSNILRDIHFYLTLPQANEWRDRFISKEEPANLLLVALRSLWGRNYTNQRYGNSDKKCQSETYRSEGPWGDMLGDFDLLFGRSGYPVKSQPKYNEIFEITNVTAQTGQPHTVQMAFTTDETLMCRAEAKVMLKKYDEAARDLSCWYVKKGGKAATVEQIVNYYTERQAKEKKDLEEGNLSPWLVLVKPFHSDFEIEAGTQEMMLQAVLHARRIETMFSGLRWLDIRRYGIEVTHNVDEGDPIVLKAGDLRRVIQIPQSVVAAGLPANPK